MNTIIFCKLGAPAQRNQIERNLIFFFTKKVLQKAIKNNGTTLSDMTYVLPQGVYGSNQNSLYIYAKDKCFSCLQKIDKILIDSRATYVCKKCQKQIN